MPSIYPDITNRHTASIGYGIKFVAQFTRNLEIATVKLFIKAAAAATVIAVPVLSFAQSNQTVTRAQVRAELTQLEKAGYDPSDYINYPANLKRAETIVARQNSANTEYGPAMNGASQSGK